MHSLSELLDRSVTCYGTARALNHWTYAEMNSRIRTCAKALRRRNAVGTPMLLDQSSGPDWVVQFFAILDAGLVAVPVIPGMPAGRVLEIVHAERIRPGTAVVLVTSPSRRAPVTIALSHRNLLANVECLLRARCAGPEETLLSVLPLAHLFELVAGVLAPLAAGARIVFARSPMPTRLAEQMCTERVTRMHLVPALFELMMTQVRDRHSFGQAFRMFTVGGAALHRRWVSVASQRGLGLEVGYGLTEAGPVVTLGNAAEIPAGSCGRALPGVEVRIGEESEVLVRGVSVTSVGWLHTGDRGRLDEAGHLFLSGRIKRAIVPSTGETVWPEEIEEHYQSPLFRGARVTKRSDAEGNDVPVLHIVPATKNELAVRRELRRLRSSAPSRLRIKEVHFMSTLEIDLRKLIERETNESLATFSAQDDLIEQLAVDSLAALRILALIETRYSVRFPDDRLAEFHTIGQLMAFIGQTGDQKTKEWSCASAS